MIYCDTSLLFSLYVADAGSKKAGEQMAQAGEPLVWTAWHELEFTAALEARVGRGANTREQADAVAAELTGHREKGGLFVHRAMNWEQALVRASDLARKWGAGFGCRSLDVLHVGICLELGIGKFWSFDERQCDLARAVGLRINEG